MNLVIDIGNSTAKIAVFDGEKAIKIIHDSNQSLDALAAIGQQYPLQKGIIASVIGLSDKIQSQLDALPFNMLHFDSQIPTPVKNLYKTPETLGADRLAAVVGAFTLLPHKDALVIDAGTCITYDYIDADGNYRGGNISPGLYMRLKALHQFTDKLPEVSPQGDTPFWGESTETAIRAGVIQGIKLEIEGYIRLMQEKKPQLFVFLTGGDNFSFDIKIKNTIFADKFLVLKGLNRILNYNDELS